MIRRAFIRRMAAGALAAALLRHELVGRALTLRAETEESLAELVHRVYVEGVMPAMRQRSPVLRLFGRDDAFEGGRLVFPVEPR